MTDRRTTWAVVLDSTTCRMYDYNKNKLTLVKEIEHPENKLRDVDLTSDKPGRYKSMGSAHGTYTQESDPKEIKIENFSREIAKILEHENTIHSYERIILIASPHMNGLLQKHINKQVKNLIASNIEKDLTDFNESQLLKYLNDSVGPS